MPILKKRQIEILSQLNDQELEKYVAALPIKPDELEELFFYIRSRFKSQLCDHTSKLTMQYLIDNRLPFPKIIAWLNENGGYCDCKVLENIETEWNKAFGNS
jgi:hypothetical protein